ncbi:MAG: hypothetical protein K9W46_00280 [Candidatus Heimdallarchaeum endolithica]|uniref:Uncharacterized protein n=1 Tax=Candidatus Heimdallarchaeum endolithica TaxID=2876572 RepID=A0A9Y1FP65_9ARCH|nr:MAG: hypothetical protein K9W46_00280 [Candidatus Heimdallarchaeum endolithica]
MIDDHSRFSLGAKLHPFAPRKEQIISLLEDAIKDTVTPSLSSRTMEHSSLPLEEKQVPSPVCAKLNRWNKVHQS